MRKVFIYSIAIWVVLLQGCGSRSVETTVVEYRTLTDQIYTRMPGTLLLCGDYLVWEDPFVPRDFVKVIDISTGGQVGVAGIIGKGPGEFVTPSIGNCQNGKLAIFDLNSDRRALFDVDSIVGGGEYQRRFEWRLVEGSNKFVVIDSETVVSYMDSLPLSMRVIRHDSLVQVFGNPLVEGEFANREEVFQTNIRYDQWNGFLVEWLPRLSYVNIYRMKDGIFKSVAKNRSSDEYEYSVKSNRIDMVEPEERILDITLTKDYIVTTEIHETDKSRDSRDLPQCLYLYDYHFRLRRIVDVGIPMLRIAADSRSNTLYAIAVKEGFSVIECTLP